MSKEDINLPKTSFSMKANLPNKEPEILKIWQKLNLYKKLRDSRKGKEKFVLHDGPPYANGHIHMGTALNKILKDMITRFHQMDGKKKKYGGVAYLGSRPTFGGKEIFLETNIFGIRKNLYKKTLRVYFLKFIRGDKKFKNSTELINQMNKDVIFAKKEIGRAHV